MTETKTEELYKNLLVLFVSIGLLFQAFDKQAVKEALDLEEIFG